MALIASWLWQTELAITKIFSEGAIVSVLKETMCSVGLFEFPYVFQHKESVLLF